MVPPRRREEIEREENIARLAGILDIGPKALTKLRKTHGPKLEAKLEQWYKETREKPRFMAKQQGRILREQYVETAVAAIEGVEVVPKHSQKAMSDEARTRWAERELRENAAKCAHDDSYRIHRRIREAAVAMANKGENHSLLFAEIERVLRKSA